MIPVEEDLIIYATRYALGRTTFAVTDCIRSIKNNTGKIGEFRLSERARAVIAADIGQFICNAPDHATTPDWVPCFEILRDSLSIASRAWLFDPCGGNIDKLGIDRIIDEIKQ